MQWDGTNPTASKVDVTIDAASIDTHEPARDTHLRSADFFDAEHFPQLTFRSKQVEVLDGDNLRIIGDLSIRGVTREVILDVESLGSVKDPWGGTRAGFTARTSVNRKDFGLTWNVMLEAGGVTVGEKVEITVDVEAVQVQVAQQQIAV